jgi:hypothetical protein
MDAIKKASIVINEYLSDFLETLNQFPTKDMDMVRQVVGHWPTVKTLMKSLIVELQKDESLNKDYVKTVLEEFKQSATILDKLSGLYDNVMNFDLEGIKTHTEPLMKLIERAKGQDQEQAPAEPAEAPAEEPEEEMTEKSAKIASELDQIANEIQEQDPVIAFAIDKVSDQFDR